jgi:hypothetical protein
MIYYFSDQYRSIRLFTYERYTQIKRNSRRLNIITFMEYFFVFATGLSHFPVTGRKLFHRATLGLSENCNILNTTSTQVVAYNKVGT